MKKIICICNTYFQLIAAVMMRKSLFIDDYMILVLTDHSNHSEFVFERIKNENVFSETYYAKVKKLDQDKHKLHEAAISVLSMITGKSGLQYKFINNIAADLILYYNQSTFVSIVFAELYRSNPNIKAARFEEGIISYRNPIKNNKKQNIAMKTRRILHKKNLYELTEQFYCIYPKYYKGKLKAVKIPKECLNDPQVLNLIKRIFLGEKSFSEYKEKYIFFSSVCDFEGECPINELELIKSIASIVGKENILIKVHPRDNIQRFLECDLHVDQNSNVPWEAIQFGVDFKNHIFLTVNSSSALMANMLLGQPAETFFLYKMCNIKNNSIAVSAVKSLETLFSDYGLCDDMTWLHVADNIDDFINL